MADVNMVMVGDVYVQRPDPATAFAPLQPYLSKADVGFCNLETVVADAKYLEPGDKSTRPRTDESILPEYLKAGFNVFNIANNPVMYHGLGCFMRHLDVLDESGVAYAGGGRNLAAARKPAIIERNGTKIAFVARTSVGLLTAGAADEKPGVARFGVKVAYEPRERALEVPGCAPYVRTFPSAKDRDALAEDIKAARSQADVVVLSWHWGVSPATGGVGDLATYQVEMGRFALDAGADMIIGHHAHVLQPIEVYKGKPIVYSIGNYVHDMGSMGEHGRRFVTMLVKVLVRDGKIAGLSYVPGIIDGNGPPNFLRPDEAESIVNYMTDISEPFGTRFEAGADEVKVDLSVTEPRNVFTEEGVARNESVAWRRASGL